MTSQLAIIAVDDSKKSEKAFEFYANKIHRPGYVAVLLHVSETIRLPSTYYITESIDHEDILKRAKQLQLENEKLMAKFCQKCIDARIEHKMMTVPDGDEAIGAVIVDVADQQNASMIVTGTRSRGAILRALMGSVSNYILHHAKIPVFVCPSED